MTSDVAFAHDPLVIEHLSHRFMTPGGEVPVLDDVSATFAPGTWTAIMGPSGSGKSTLMLCAAGLLRASEGNISLAGTPLRDASEKELTRLRRTKVGFIFQSFNLVPSLTAAQNTELPLRLAGQRPKRAVAVQALDRVGLNGRARHLPGELSGGQQQRVAIARALVTTPEVIFADEPTGALDSHTSTAVLDLFQDMIAEGSTVVIVTHDARVAARADRVLFLFDGRFVDEVAGGDAQQIAARLARLENAQGRGAA